jgi:predicted negative regulator of RcsB-dependent stress response
MAQETSHTSPGFGKNTNGLGIAIVVVVLVVFALVGWNFWKTGTAEQKWYRFENKAAGHEGHGAGHAAAAPAAAVGDSSAAPAADGTAAEPAHDSSGVAH